MRLWSLHPRYLDSQGLVAAWREALLAQAVLAGRTRGYQHHPQLDRFRASRTPLRCVAAYLRALHDEATARGYRFDASKIGRAGEVEPIAVTRGQMAHEWKHLEAKLRRRSPAWLAELGKIARVKPHPLFKVVAGGIADWERA
ncbi:pyrimidine dimer DNA glycosylase/endonuclease V [Usitatibacter palustris]|uniref:Pyrimidine dimer DNA glycosylase /DNA-(Apurinic or apyrimidinic site) lyase n=1 Tax=Usitatibacter palustris TaxID=2732487 RepID=A0A6M4H278_9PROT|nr:pyrimidine dimer DNA glycosylase/endonuclease V [Usitatibacter palustris]QJR13586.1 hypothetical protein DSM104440_00370 [Usitatibacter palustris]